MMENNCNIQTNVRNFHSTAKTCHEIRNPSNQLTLRERQFLIMLTSDGNFCSDNYCDNRAYCDFCNHLMERIDFQNLIERGYLVLKDGAELSPRIEMVEEDGVNDDSTDIEIEPVEVTNIEANGSIVIEISHDHKGYNNANQSNDNNETEQKNTQQYEDIELPSFLRMLSGNFDN